jgi:uncharacterized protein YhfF
MDADVYWAKFLKDTGRDQGDRCAGDFSFESRGFTGNEQLTLVLSGRKTAAFSSYATYGIDNEPLPVSGELYVVVDRNGDGRCVIEVTGVSVIPFKDVTWEMAQQEGEDENLEAWRDKQKEYLREEGDIVGFQFTPEIHLVYMTFLVIYH